MAETSVGMDEKIEGALCYVLGWITGIIFYIIEQKNEFVRDSMQDSLFLRFFHCQLLHGF